LQCIYLAHLSQECNRPELALREVTRVLQAGAGHGIDVRMTYPDRESEPWEAAVTGAAP
jgi:hypothetical protein